jgi:hypothetical protein
MTGLKLSSSPLPFNLRPLGHLHSVLLCIGMLQMKFTLLGGKMKFWRQKWEQYSDRICLSPLCHVCENIQSFSNSMPRSFVDVIETGVASTIDSSLVMKWTFLGHFWWILTYLLSFFRQPVMFFFGDFILYRLTYHNNKKRPSLAFITLFWLHSRQLQTPKYCNIIQYFIINICIYVRYCTTLNVENNSRRCKLPYSMRAYANRMVSTRCWWQRRRHWARICPGNQPWQWRIKNKELFIYCVVFFFTCLGMGSAPSQERFFIYLHDINTVKKLMEKELLSKLKRKIFSTKILWKISVVNHDLQLIVVYTFTFKK